MENTTATESTMTATTDLRPRAVIEMPETFTVKAHEHSGTSILKVNGWGRVDIDLDIDHPALGRLSGVADVNEHADDGTDDVLSFVTQLFLSEDRIKGEEDSEHISQADAALALADRLTGELDSIEREIYDARQQIARIVTAVTAAKRDHATN